MTSISLTGGNGFVGMNLIPYLTERGHNVGIISRKDLNDIKNIGVGDSTAIVHLAGKAHDVKNANDPDEYFKINFELTTQLYDAFLKSNAKKFIFISSVKSCADSISGTLTEDYIPSPRTDYGKSKLLAEEYIRKQQLPEGKSYFILRPCMIHGPGNKGNLNLLYKVVQIGLPYPLAAFENKRSFLSIINLNLIIEKILSSSNNIESGVYNVSDDDALSTNRVIELIAYNSNVKPRLWKVSPRLIQLFTKFGDKFNLPLNSERLRKLTETYVVSNKKIKTALDIKELPISSEQGLVLTIKSFQNK